MVFETLHDVARNALCELYESHHSFLTLLPKLSGASRAATLRDYFEWRLHVAYENQKVLEKIAKEFEISHTCSSDMIMHALIEKVKWICSLEGTAEVRDAALAGIAQRMEFDLISQIHLLHRYAHELRLINAEKHLRTILETTQKAQQRLDHIAQGDIFDRGLDKKALARTHQ